MWAVKFYLCSPVWHFRYQNVVAFKITGCHVGFCSQCSESNGRLQCSVGKWFKCKLCRPTLFPRGVGYEVTHLVETLC
jgi:hypothetical protein